MLLIYHFILINFFFKGWGVWVLSDFFFRGKGVVFFWKGEEIELVKVCIKCKHRTDNRVAQDLTI